MKEYECPSCHVLHDDRQDAVECCMLQHTPADVLPPVPEPKAAELLGRAAKHMHERAATYDKPEGERSMGRAVDAFNAVTGHTLKESEGWLFMALLKAVRSETRSEPHQDSLEDLIAYTALYAEARGDGK